MNKMISIIIPVYNEEGSINQLLDRINAVTLKLAEKISVEVILIDDHSTDKTPEFLSKVCTTNKNIKSIRLSRNSGSHVAIIAGLSLCKGDCAVFLAADLQDPPELILDMIHQWE